MCVLPWIHLCASVDGVYGRCCVDGAMYHNDLYEQESVPVFALNEDALGCAPNSRYARDNPAQTIGLAEAFNSPNMRRTRLAMLAGERVAACEYCYQREDRGAQSYREDINRRFADSISFADLAKRTAPDGSVDGFPFFLDIRFGNTCNLRCVMCSYPVSSGWGAVKRPAWSAAAIDPYRDDGQLWDTLAENAHLIRRLYFAGGEPFMQPGHFRLLDLLIETDNAHQVDIVYNSNMTILPDGIFAKLARFKSVGIGASCDGVGETFEKIRVGARWDVFVRNIRQAKSQVGLWLQVAPQRDNIWGLRELLRFARDEDIDVDLANIVQWPPELSVSNLSAEEKRRATAELSDLIRLSEIEGRGKIAHELAMLRSYMNAGEP
jgi:sulfatase maturation enzyme AslB (radical SAM superfamily)